MMFSVVPVYASQHDMEITTADANTGLTFRAAINAALQALVSQNTGATAPTTTYAGMFWADTTASLLKMRNKANSAWVTLGPLDTDMLGYLTLATDQTVTAQHTISPGSAKPPFVLGANAQAQLVVGLAAQTAVTATSATSATSATTATSATSATNATNADNIKVSSNDTTPGYLNGKLVAGSNITLTEGTDGGNETLSIAATGVADGAITTVKMATGAATGVKQSRLITQVGGTTTTVTTADDVITVTSSSTRVVNLYAVSGNTGRILTIISLESALTVTPSGSEKIGNTAAGSSTYTVPALGSVTILCTGVLWRIIGSHVTL